MKSLLHRGEALWTGLCTLGVACAAAVGAPAALADDAPACPSWTEAPYAMKLVALTGPAGADLAITMETDVAGCAAPTELKHVRLQIFAADGSLERTRNLTDVAAPKGFTDIDLGAVPRNRRVEADVLVQTGTPARTHVVRGHTTTLLRPDLVIEPLQVPPQTLTTRPVTLKTFVTETNGDVGAAATVELTTVLGPLRTVEVRVGAGERVPVTFTAVALTQAVPTELKVAVKAAVPAETNDGNNARTATVDVTEHELPVHRVVLFPSLLGYGAQFNNHLYAPITSVQMPQGAYPDVEAKVKQLEPQLVRIFYNDNWEENIDGTHPESSENYASFVKVVRLAKEAGATVDISYQNLGNVTNQSGKSPKRTAQAAMHSFADALEDLVVNHGLTNVRWATIGNEPNTAGALITYDRYEELYRALQSELVARGLRDDISLMAGGFIESSGDSHQKVWLPTIAQRIGDILDAYAIHVYWWYDKPGRLEYRLRDTYNLTMTLLPPELRKPVYMMEFGIRGYDSCGSMPVIKNLHRYYRDANCTEIWRTNIAGFQQLWFAIDSAQLGVAGASKWDAYWAVYDRNSLNQQTYWMTGPPDEGYPLTPTYHAMSLLYHVTAPGWQIIRVEPWQDDDWLVPNADDGTPMWGTTGGEVSADQPEQELSAYAGPNGELTIMGLDTNGRALDVAAAAPPVAYSIGGLSPNATFTLALWNATGDGANSVAGTVTTNAAGVARFDVPLQAAFALTNVPVE
jgi:hypothetical protein